MKKLYGATLEERLTYNSEVTDSGCREWRRQRQKNGYGRINVAGRMRLVHRVAYETWVGPIPAGLVIDHLCRNRACINPSHMRACTQRENTTAEHSLSPAALCARKTHCHRGHEFSPENTRITSQGKRECKTCRRDWDRARAQTPARQEYERQRAVRRRESGEWRVK